MGQEILGKVLNMYRQPSMSVEDVANKLHKNVEDIQKWESGELEPTLYEKGLLSILYNIPLNLLTYDYNKDIAATINCRAVGDFNNLPDEYKFIFASKVDNLRSFLKIVNNELLKEKPIANQQQFIHLEDAELDILNCSKEINDKVKDIILKKAYEFRKFEGFQQNGPIQDLLKQMEKRMAVLVFSQMPADYSGLSFVSDKYADFYIFINSGDHYCKQTFTLLHEVAHVIFNLVDNDTMIEEYANCFANFVLLPPEDVQFNFKDFKLDNIEQYRYRFEIVSQMYEVGYKTIIYSLLNNNIISKEDLLKYGNNFADKIILQYFNKEYSVIKESLRTNEKLNGYLKELIESGHMSYDFAIQMNFGKPFIN